uniref:hypothetical protein n=1 Tax=Thaumasiovibrio occultus TaxID=1891184 RepID=UPI000B3552E8|nr:hypothetical protein [Thaumasiovibrio occultus]
MFADQIECYQAVCDELVQVINDEWDSIEIEAKYSGQSSIDITAVYLNRKGRHPILNFVMVPRYFFELARLVSTEDKGLYKVCNFKLDCTGKFNVDFEY